MTPFRAIALIWDSDENYQSVVIEYEGERDNGRFIVDRLKVLVPIEIEANDFVVDLCTAIENDQQVWMVRIECEIELTEPQTKRI